MKVGLLNLIESKVTRFRQFAGLSDSEAVNLNSLLLKLNILTVFRPLSKSFSGMSLLGNGKRFMLINSSQPVCRQHFTIAHELYHLFMEDTVSLHACQENGKKSESEQCADAFALMFLMPASGVIQMIPDTELKSSKISLATILKLGQYFGVSNAAVVNRLSDMNLLSRAEREHFSSIPVKRSARDYGYSTALYEPGNEGLVIGDFGEKARRLYEQDKISEGHYLELLHKIGIDGNED